MSFEDLYDQKSEKFKILTLNLFGNENNIISRLSFHNEKVIGYRPCFTKKYLGHYKVFSSYDYPNYHCLSHP